MDTQCKWSTTEYTACGVFYAVTKWNFYLQGAEVIVHDEYKLLPRFLNEKNTNNKVNRWVLELATHHVTLEWISGAQKKAANYLLQLVELSQQKPATVNILSATNLDGTAFNTRSRTAHCTTTEDPTTTPTPLTTDRLQELLQMQRTGSVSVSANIF